MCFNIFFIFSSLSIHFVSDFFCDYTFTRKASKYGPFTKNGFIIQKHYESAKPALNQSDLSVRKYGSYFCLHPGGFGEIVSTFTIFYGDLHGGKRALLLKRPLKRDPFAIAHEGQREFLAAFVVEFYLGIKFVVIDGFIKRFSGHCDYKVINLQAGL